jgi:hypothetical protein
MNADTVYVLHASWLAMLMYMLNHPQIEEYLAKYTPLPDLDLQVQKSLLFAAVALVMFKATSAS